MLDVFFDHPGLLFVVATLLPIASFVLLLLAGAARSFLRGCCRDNKAADAVFKLLGGEVTGRGPALVALGAIALAFVFSFAGFIAYLGEHEENEERLGINTSLLHLAQDKYHHASGED